MSSDPHWPLAGLRIVDLSTEIAGPYASKLLVDAGADVVKVESPKGDPLRRWTASGVAIPSGEDGALFQFLNASKQSVVIDLESQTGRKQWLALAGSADLVLESEAPGALDRAGLGLEVLQRHNPALSLVSITAWGQEGPWAKRPASEFTLQAACGSIDYRGLRDREPVAAGGRIGEWAAGSFGAVGALTAWLSARRSGRGQHVDLSIFESMLLCLTIYGDLGSQWFEGPLARAIEIPSIEPAKDGWVGFCTITGQQWKDFCSMLGRQDVGDDARFLDGRMRMDAIEEMQRMIHAWTRERSIEEMIELATLFRIPVAPIGNGRNLPDIDHFQERGVYSRSAGGFLQPRIPYQLEKTPLRPLGAAPKLGADTDSVLAELASRQPSVPQDPKGEADALPLRGLRVLDMTAFWAGPFATAFLSDMGADVVKVESIHRPDGMRFAGAVPGPQLWEWSPVFAGANPGKRDITLQIDDAEGRRLLEELIRGADVLIENYSARVFENFGLGWEAVREINPRIVMLRMPAFGLSGPWRDRAGFAMTVEQVSGLAWMTGYEDMPLVVRGACDPIGGMHAVFALLGALEHRRRTGEGQLVEVPLVESALNLAAEQVIEYSAYGTLLERQANRGPVAAPQGLYESGDEGQLLALAVVDDAQWRSLRTLLGDPAWARAAALDTAEGRRAHHDEIDAQVEAWARARTRESAVDALLEAGIPASPVINAHHLTPNPQLEARDFFQIMEHPVTGSTRYPGFPMRYSGLPAALHRSPSPTLGQHNQDILAGELGLGEDEIAALRERKVIGERPSFM